MKDYTVYDGFETWEDWREMLVEGDYSEENKKYREKLDWNYGPLLNEDLLEIFQTDGEIANPAIGVTEEGLEALADDYVTNGDFYQIHMGGMRYDYFTSEDVEELCRELHREHNKLR